MESANKFLIIAVVVGFVVEIRGQDHADGAGRKIIEFAPNHGTDIDSRIGAIQVEAFFLSAVVQNHVETSRHRNDKLMQMLMSVTAALGSAGNVIKIVNALDFKGDMPPAFDEREIASRLIDFRQIEHLAVGQAHEFISSRLLWGSSAVRSIRIIIILL